MSRVLVISDLQAPFQHHESIPFLQGLYRKHKCNEVVCIGDPYDAKFLKYLSINDPMSANQQHEESLSFFKRLYKAFPEVKVCNCNHTVERLESVAQGASIPKFMLKTPKEFMEAPDGWIWADQWIIDDVHYSHGHKWGGKYAHIKALETKHRSSVIGHHPILSVRYFVVGGVSKFAMGVGALTIDANDARMGWGMKYSKKYATEMPIGAGVVIEGLYAYAEPLV